MNKETLSNYGWIVICVLVISVMVALATPFGNYVKSAVENTTQGLFDVEQKALVAGGLTIAGQSFGGDSDSASAYDGTNLTGTTWELVEYPDGGLYKIIDDTCFGYSIDFISDGNSYSSIYCGMDGETYYDDTTVRIMGLLRVPEKYRTIIITGGEDATNPDAIAWFEANATLVE